MSEAERRLTERGIVVPEAPRPIAKYAPTVQVGNLLFVSGQGPTVNGTPVFQGTVGHDLTEGEAVAAAELCALNSLAVIKQELGSLDRVRRVVKLLGFVASANTYDRQPFVIDGASEVFLNAFGEAGRHARSAIGTNALPFGIPVEVEVIVEVANDE